MLDAITTVPLDVSTPRGLTTRELTTIATLARDLPGRWIAVPERTDEDQLYVGLVAPRVDKWAFQVLIGGLQGGAVSVRDWRGNAVAEAVGLEEAFAAIREALRSTEVRQAA